MEKQKFPFRKVLHRDVNILCVMPEKTVLCHRETIGEKRQKPVEKLKVMSNIID